MGFFLVSYASKNLAIEGFKNIKYVQIAGQNVKVDLALTSAEHSRGLSGRSILNKDEGMLFVFVKSGRYYFWMKEMNFPIDIVWFTKDMKIIYIKKNANPLLYPETYGPSVNSKYVLEVPAGFADKNNLKVGDNVLFTY
jgi:hypothetical protein